MRLTEGSMAPVDCVDEELGSCSRMDNCATAVVWKKLNDAISDVIDNITLADLVDWQIAKDGDYILIKASRGMSGEKIAEKLFEIKEQK